MKLETHYKNLYTQSIEKITAGNYGIDRLIDSPDDRRYGMTLLLRPSPEVKEKISYFLSDMMKIDPNQYYYPESDMHITVLSIISCHQGFDISKIETSEYIDILRRAISEINSFSIDLRGVTASPSCIMVQGFPQNEILNSLRDRIRALFKDSTLENSIDIRYELKTAHSTVIRFKKKLDDRDNYINRLEHFRAFDFGSFEVESLELVCNDWYLRDWNTRKLMSFNLQKQ